MELVSDTGELLYLRKYQEAIMSFNRLDRNMAFCIRWAAQNAGLDVSIETIYSYSYDKKLRKIETMIRSKNLESEYSLFLDSAKKCRLFRNKMVHGDWQFNERLEEPIRFHVLSPADEQGSFTQDEFAARINQVNDTNSLFNKLRKTHPIE